MIPIHTACAFGKEEVIKLLLQYIPEQQVTCRAQDIIPLRFACRLGLVEGIRLLLQYDPTSQVQSMDYSKSIALHEACYCGPQEAVELLLMHDPVAQITHKNALKILPLHEAAGTKRYDTSGVLLRLLEESPETQVMHKDGFGNLPWHLACTGNRLDALEILFSYIPEKQLAVKIDGHSIPRIVQEREIFFQVFCALFCRGVLPEEMLPLVATGETCERMRQHVAHRRAKSARTDIETN